MRPLALLAALSLALPACIGDPFTAATESSSLLLEDGGPPSPSAPPMSTPSDAVPPLDPSLVPTGIADATPLPTSPDGSRESLDASPPALALDAALGSPDASPASDAGSCPSQPCRCVALALSSDTCNVAPGFPYRAGVYTCCSEPQGPCCTTS